MGQGFQARTRCGIGKHHLGEGLAVEASGRGEHLLPELGAHRSDDRGIFQNRVRLPVGVHDDALRARQGLCNSRFTAGNAA